MNQEDKNPAVQTCILPQLSRTKLILLFHYLLLKTGLKNVKKKFKETKIVLLYKLLTINKKFKHL